LLLLKARLVVGGHREHVLPDMDTASPTVRFETLLLCFNIASYHKYEIMTGDIGAAFLESTLQRDDIFIKLDQVTVSVLQRLKPHYTSYLQPDGSIVVRLVKVVYGLKESSMEFYKHLVKVLKRIGFAVSEYDAGLLYRRKNASLQLVCIHVDDFSVYGTKEDNRELPGYLKKCFKKVAISSGARDFPYLGMHVEYNPSSGLVLLSQPGYIDKILKEFQIGPDYKSEVPYSKSLFDVDEGDTYQVELFRSRVMMLSYLCKTRPDIRLSVAYLSTRVSNPTKKDHLKLLRVAKYLNATKHLKFRILTKDLQLYVSADASYAINVDCKSQSGVMLWLGWGDSSFYCSSKKQSLVTRSSTESELVALTSAVDQALWTRRLLNELGLDCGQICVEQDNISAMWLTQNTPGRKSASKAIQVRYFWIRQYLEDGTMVLRHTPSLSMVSDGLSKPLESDRFIWWRDVIMNIDGASSGQ
jgi:hypothetical protein